MPDQHERTSSSRAVWRLRWLERLLLVAGAAALIWCGVIVADGVIAQRNARSVLEIALAIDEPSWIPAANTHAPPHDSPVPGSAIAALSVPRLHLSAVVLHGSDAQTLQRGPGRLENTADPGEPGNVVIAGHRDSFFRPLRNIRMGDDIFLDTREGRFRYEVTSLRVVGPHDIDVLAPTSEEVLTLITCYPFWVLGPAPDRFVVRAMRVADHASAHEARRSPALDRAAVPPVETVTVSESIPIHAAAAKDDESLVRQAVRRYLLVRGSRTAACAVMVSDDRATADCESVRPQSSEQEQPGRVFSLERSNDAWAIRSIVLK